MAVNLDQKLGPFDVKTWLIIGVGGIGAGYLLTRSQGARSAGSVSGASVSAPIQRIIQRTTVIGEEHVPRAGEATSPPIKPPSLPSTPIIAPSIPSTPIVRRRITTQPRIEDMPRGPTPEGLPGNPPPTTAPGTPIPKCPPGTKAYAVGTGYMCLPGITSTV